MWKATSSAEPIESVGEAAGVPGLLGARRGGIAELRQPQVLCARLQPRQRCDRRALERLGMTLREVPAGAQHRLDVGRIGIEKHCEGGVRRSGVAQ